MPSVAASVEPEEVVMSSVGESVVGEGEMVLLASAVFSVALSVSLDGETKDRTDQVGLERSFLMSTRFEGSGNSMALLFTCSYLTFGVSSSWTL